LAWKDDSFWVPAVQIDDDRHWNPQNYDDAGIDERIEAKRNRLKGNRLVEQLAICAKESHCFAAKNFFSERWECPLPVSPGCNSSCVGCISSQPGGDYSASMERLKFVPEPDEIAELAADHLKRAAEPLLSFGQGCEGDPLLQANVIEKAIRKIKSEFPDSSVNINTNASLPAEVNRLAQAGLDSIRVSINSGDPKKYRKYYRPSGYTFDNVLESIRIAYDCGVFVNLNLLIFPGISDQEEEIEKLTGIIRNYGVHRIQMKNLNIDPQLYLEIIGYPEKPGVGILQMMNLLKNEIPALQFGYFNLQKSEYFNNKQFI
jgi:pyruvate-formate lyase-activating enzyme